MKKIRIAHIPNAETVKNLRRGKFFVKVGEGEQIIVCVKRNIVAVKFVGLDYTVRCERSLYSIEIVKKFIEEQLLLKQQILQRFIDKIDGKKE